jgi:hypothetical protein
VCKNGGVPFAAKGKNGVLQKDNAHGDHKGFGEVDAGGPGGHQACPHVPFGKGPKFSPATRHKRLDRLGERLLFSEPSSRR